MFNDIYSGKKVIITGNTGFKGAWLSIWLSKMGAHVIGISKDVPTSPAMYEELDIAGRIRHYQEDIRNLAKMIQIVDSERPDFLFHLAAQAIVSVSYSCPMETISTNVIGTANILEALRLSNHSCVAVIITSDKAYDNIEQLWGYKENDYLGGKDVYSGSKGAAELIIKSYYQSFFKSKDSNIKLAVGRAGNVIGGGDWAQNRIVVDCMLSWGNEKKVVIRNPNSTRPWQHVLEPLSGYLYLGAQLYKSDELHGEAFNFGPRAEDKYSVVNLLKDLSAYWGFPNVDDCYAITGNISFHEAGLLKLNCDKALYYLKWHANLEYHEMVRLTSEWYYTFYRGESDMLEKTLSQINEYESLAAQRGLPWTE
ncbi:CDP-glucose 4,6-dehydratase [Acidithiobacillus ferrivorans]|nr:CDP-glucose 4,6-dehydratase [Acidithiobacillus ferrivorans]